jgi:hypothetical protein
MSPGNSMKKVNNFFINRYANRQNINLVFVGFAVVLGSFLEWGLFYIALFSFSVYLVLTPKSSRFSVSMGIISVVISGFLYLVHRFSMAENFALACYVFLIVAILTIFFEYLEKGSQK